MASLLRLLAFFSACITVVGSVSWKRHDGASRMLKDDNGVGRIIGGQDADPTRYPYMVYLRGRAACGGTLIAPDVILTAAHCFSSRDSKYGVAFTGEYNLQTDKDNAETHVFQEVVSHPRYYQPKSNRGFFPDEFDYTLIKIYDQSRVGEVIKLNKDPLIPDSIPDTPLHLLGWGRTVFDESESRSAVLKEADVSFIPNDECSQISGFDRGNPYSLENMVFDITLCAGDFEDREDTCGGDSGGPILLKGEDATQDVQLGLTSYGPVECGHSSIPAVYARVSYVYDWIRDHVCRMSLNPPADFGCSSKFTKPNLSSHMVELTLEFLADAYAGDVGWIIQSPNDDDKLVTYAYQPIGTFPPGTNRNVTFNLSNTFSLPNNRYYILTMLDAYGDGYSGGPFEVKLSTDDDTLLDEELIFENYTIEFEFVVGTLPTPSPTVTPAPTTTMPPSMAPTVVPPIVWVVIKFDDRPDETGWRVEAISKDGESQTLAEVYPGTYNDKESISEQVRLLPYTEMSYMFTLTDNEANGICCDEGEGSYQVWLGEPDTGEMIAQGRDLVWEISHSFTIYMAKDGSYTSVGESSSAAAQCGLALAVLLALSIPVAMLL